MDNQNISGPQLTLEEVSAQLDNWHKTKTSLHEPIPKKLRKQAAELCQKHSVSIISNTLRLSYTDLKERVYGLQYLNWQQTKKILFLLRLTQLSE